MLARGHQRAQPTPPCEGKGTSCFRTGGRAEIFGQAQPWLPNTRSENNCLPGAQGHFPGPRGYEPPSHHTWAKTEFSLVQKDSKQSLADSREDGPSSVALCATGLPRQWPSRSRYSAFCLLHKLPSPHSQASARGEAFPCQLFWKINKPTAIILTASADKCSKQQDTKPRFPNGIAFPFFFFGFDKFYRVALLRRGQVL